MGDGQDILNAAKYRAKAIIKQFAKKLSRMLLTNPYTYVILAIIFLIIIIAGEMVDVNSSGGSNSQGMSSVVSGTDGSKISINVYNDDGTVNEEKIQELQLALENAYGLVTGSLSGNNIGGEYNKESCEKVTGTYLGFNYWNGSIPRSKLGGIIYQCPWWANGRASEVNGKKVQIFGHAKDMYTNAINLYYSVGSKPEANSLVVYRGGEYGHVAYVEAVDNVNRCYYISHAGSGKSWFGIQKIEFGSAPWSGYSLIGFIYVGLN